MKPADPYRSGGQVQGACLGRVSFNELAFRRGNWDGLTVLTKILKVKVDCFFDKFPDFFPCFGHSDTTWKVRDMSAPTRLAFFNDNEVTHAFTPSTPPV